MTVISKHLEMGQGTYTGLATIVAEELDADWSQVRVEGAPADAKRYNNLSWGGGAGHRRQHRDRQFLGTAAQGRRLGARDAGGGRGSGSGRCRPARSRSPTAS